MIIMLNEHNMRLIPNDLSFYPQITTPLKPHMRSFFLYQWRVTQKPMTNCLDEENKRLRAAQF